MRVHMCTCKQIHAQWREVTGGAGTHEHGRGRAQNGKRPSRIHFERPLVRVTVSGRHAAGSMLSHAVTSAATERHRVLDENAGDWGELGI